MTLLVSATLLLAAMLALSALGRALVQERGRRKDAERRRRAYEKALALPFWSDKEIEKELWNRAAAGDELAEEVVSELCIGSLQRRATLPVRPKQKKKQG